MVLVVLVCSPRISLLSREVEPELLSLGKSGLVFVVFGGILRVSGTAWDTG